MEDTLLSLVINVASERREACEWLSLTSHVEEQKYRQYSADLERRRRRKYNTHLEEQKKVEKELNDLQKDRQRFEREKQLRRRKSWSAFKVKKNVTKSQQKEKKQDYPFHGGTMGGSASIAFDPKIQKTSRRKSRKAKTEKFTKTKKKQEHEENEENLTNFPYLSEKEVIKFHQSCKSAGLRAECRRWGAAWLYAKKEQDETQNKDQRWNTMLLNAEKEKMRSLCDKLNTLNDDSRSWIKSKPPNNINYKQVLDEAKKLSGKERHTFQRESSMVFKEHCENIKAAMNGPKQTTNKENSLTSKFSTVKPVNTWAIKSPNIIRTLLKRKELYKERKNNLQAIEEVLSLENSSTSSTKSKSTGSQSKSFLPDL